MMISAMNRTLQFFRKRARPSGGVISALLALALPGPDGLRAQEMVEVAEFSVHAGDYERENLPVRATVDGVPLQSFDGGIQLFEITASGAVPVASQLVPGDPVRIAWILSGTTPPGAVRNYELRVPQGIAGAAATGASPDGGVEFEDTGTDLLFTVGGKEVLGYRYEPMPVPDGVSDVFSLSGFIHPLRAPQGEVLTRIQPPDHYHHYGIWNPWTRTTFEGRSVDFWNVGDRQGRVLSDGVLSMRAGDVFGGYTALHRHIDHTSGSDKVAMTEEVEVTIWNADPEQRYWVVDFNSRLNPLSDLTINAYRYQGFSMRFTGRWGDDNARLLSSEGRNKSNGNATRARWLDVNGVSDASQGTSGVLFMSTPSNYNFPEQLRIWPTGQGVAGATPGTENVYINFNPAQEEDWVLRPGGSYSLKYRMLVYDGSITPEEAEKLWQSYANPPRIDVSIVDDLY